mgnify:CR=1 FL=1
MADFVHYPSTATFPSVLFDSRKSRIDQIENGVSLQSLYPSNLALNSSIDFPLPKIKTFSIIDEDRKGHKSGPFYLSGERGIRTPEGLTTLTVFKTAAFSQTPPSLQCAKFLLTDTLDMAIKHFSCLIILPT